MSTSNDLSKKWLDHTYGATTNTPPATVYIALFTSDPGDGTGGTEATGTGYARKAVTNNTTNFTNATGSTVATKTNGTDIVFAAAGTGGWSSGANMTHWASMDASSGGNRLHTGALTVPKPVADGDVVTIAAGSLTITQD
jgi:hypothetical protein